MLLEHFETTCTIAYSNLKEGIYGQRRSLKSKQPFRTEYLKLYKSVKPAAPSKQKPFQLCNRTKVRSLTDTVIRGFKNSSETPPLIKSSHLQTSDNPEGRASGSSLPGWQGRAWCPGISWRSLWPLSQSCRMHRSRKCHGDGSQICSSGWAAGCGF